MKMLTRLLKKNKCDQNLASAATVIVGLENKLAQKEEKAEGLRVSLGQLYQDAALGKRSGRQKTAGGQAQPGWIHPWRYCR